MGPRDERIPPSRAGRFRFPSSLGCASDDEGRRGAAGAPESIGHVGTIGREQLLRRRGMHIDRPFRCPTRRGAPEGEGDGRSVVVRGDVQRSGRSERREMAPGGGNTEGRGRSQADGRLSRRPVGLRDRRGGGVGGHVLLGHRGGGQPRIGPVGRGDRRGECVGQSAPSVGGAARRDGASEPLRASARGRRRRYRGRCRAGDAASWRLVGQGFDAAAVSLVPRDGTKSGVHVRAYDGARCTSITKHFSSKLTGAMCSLDTI
mmetsp:Transcript_8242/g.24746  ORF Transcript_8242/g.24746 Transcript_8242/m.24746 type:complete len:261 (+) Transcript_8242:1118-1900(+)